MSQGFRDLSEKKETTQFSTPDFSVLKHCLSQYVNGCHNKASLPRCVTVKFIFVQFQEANLTRLRLNAKFSREKKKKSVLHSLIYETFFGSKNSTYLCRFHSQVAVFHTQTVLQYFVILFWSHDSTNGCSLLTTIFGLLKTISFFEMTNQSFCWNVQFLLKTTLLESTITFHSNYPMSTLNWQSIHSTLRIPKERWLWTSFVKIFNWIWAKKESLLFSEKKASSKSLKLISQCH